MPFGRVGRPPAGRRPAGWISAARSSPTRWAAKPEPAERGLRVRAGVGDLAARRRAGSGRRRPAGAEVVSPGMATAAGTCRRRSSGPGRRRWSGSSAPAGWACARWRGWCPGRRPRSPRRLSPSALRSRTGIASCRAGVSPYQTGSPSRQIRPWRNATSRCATSGPPTICPPGRPGRRWARWSGAPGRRRGTVPSSSTGTHSSRSAKDRSESSCQSPAMPVQVVDVGRARARCAPRPGRAAWTRHQRATPRLTSSR